MPKVLYEKRDRIAYVTINRPEAMNPIDLETHELLWETWRDFRDDDGVDVAILTGAGDEAFCAGADLKTFVPSWIEQADATFPRKDRLSLSQIAEGRMNGVSCRGLTKSFPGVRALHDVDLDVPPGRVVVLLGENGAGKSTLARILSGVYPPDAGSMSLDGRVYTPSDPADAIAAGIGMIHQEGSLLPQLSIAENIFLGRLPLRRGLVDYNVLRHRAREELTRVGLEVEAERPVARLSVAAKQQAEIAKALSLHARVLILDEPTAALGSDESERLFALIDDLKTHGVAFLCISHRLEEVARVGDTIVVLRDGERVKAWDRADVGVDELIEAMVGRSVDQVFPEPPAPRDDAVLHVEGLSRSGAFEDVSFTLRRGEVLSIAGLVGAGRTELARALFGAEPPDRGRVALDGEELRLRGPADAVASGIVLVPEDRKDQGLVLDLSHAGEHRPRVPVEPG